MPRLPALLLCLTAGPALATVQAVQAGAPATGAVPYIYDPADRRDPFVGLIGTGGDSTSAPKRTGEGIAAMKVDEVSVRGIMQSRDRFVAMVTGPDNRTYLIHQGDKLADGVVKSVMPDGLVLLQDVTDPRATEKTREVRKLLRSAEDEKE